MKHLDAVNTSCRKSVRNAGLSPEEYFATKLVGGKLIRQTTSGLEKSLEFIVGSSESEINTNVATDYRLQTPDSKLFVSFLMTVLSQSFFTFMRRNFMTLPFFTTRHTQIIF